MWGLAHGGVAVTVFFGLVFSLVLVYPRYYSFHSSYPPIISVTRYKGSSPLPALSLITCHFLVRDRVLKRFDCALHTSLVILFGPYFSLIYLPAVVCCSECVLICVYVDMIGNTGCCLASFFSLSSHV